MLSTILETIGNTPLLNIDGTLVKCEYMNPSGSIKARMVSYFIERAEEEGLITPGDTLVEATSGNTGNALAMVGAAKGYKVLILMPQGYTHERMAISKAYGAELRYVGDFHLNEAVAMAKALGEQDGHWCPCQFENEWNIDENARWLGPEIIKQLPEGVTVDAIVQGVGTGGTLVGVGRAMRENHNPDVKLIAVEPTESSTISTGLVGKHMIEGIADGFVPPILRRNLDLVDEVITIKSQDAVDSMRRLASEKGFLVGSSSGANLLAAEAVRRRHPELKTVLTFFCDEGEKYLLQYYPV